MNGTIVETGTVTGGSPQVQTQSSGSLTNIFNAVKDVIVAGTSVLIPAYQAKTQLDIAKTESKAALTLAQMEAAKVSNPNAGNAVPNEQLTSNKTLWVAGGVGAAVLVTVAVIILVTKK